MRFGVALRLAFIGVRMCGVGLPVGRVLGGEVRAADDQQVLGVVLFGSRREVEAARNDGLAVDDHDLVVGDGVLGVDLRGDAGVNHEVRRRILLGPLALVEDDLNLDAPLVGIDRALAMGTLVKRVGLHQDRGLGGVEFLDHGLRAAAFRREVDLDRRQAGLVGGDLGRCLPAAGKAEKDEQQEDWSR